MAPPAPGRIADDPALRALSMGERANGRPSRAEIDPAALDLVRRYSVQVLRAARRYSLTAEDAEDAYQRGLEILLTKAPSTHEDELLPWLKTVVKHEALSIRRQRERSTPVGHGEGVLEHGPGTSSIDERAERYERLRLGAEALGRLKPQEIRCLLLRAEGYSYKQICEITGWSYTKVNRCLTEGRHSFRKRVAGIESGAECDRLAPLLSALADGEAGARELVALRRHLRGCLACRATLRDYRSAPGRVAALLPPVAVAGQGDVGGFVSRTLESLAGTLAQKASSLGEVASAQKVAAIAASTAAIAGGGAATVSLRQHREPVRHERSASTAKRSPAPVAPARPPARQPRPTVHPKPASAPKPSPPEDEFGPAGTAPGLSPDASAASSAPARSPARSSRPRPSGGGQSEFTP